MKKTKIIISIIGIGYVGLPLSVGLSKKYKVIAYDSNKRRIQSLLKNNDTNNEIRFKSNKNLQFTNNKADLFNSNVYIITVPTPVDNNNNPNLKFINNATKLVSKFIKPNSLVVYESTVYPGLTEEHCVPLLEKHSNLKFIKDFNVGYSPERINPGDNIKTIQNIYKLISASNYKSLKLMHKIYSSVTPKIYECSSIKIAEAAKVIENSQRDINIAFINELFLIFNKLNINLNEVLDAANTKWNFLNFKPGLVGGHCIGVDPYYLTYKAQKNLYFPKVILSGRKINDEMFMHYSNYYLNLLKSKFNNLKNIKILILGFAFKENCSDFRNTQVYNVIKYLYKRKLTKIDVYDNLVDEKLIYKNYKIKILKKLNKKYDSIFLIVPHKKIKNFTLKYIKTLLKKEYVIFDPSNSWRSKIKTITL